MVTEMVTGNKDLKRLADGLEKNNLTLERLTVTVEEHSRRTGILEEAIKPLMRHDNQMQGALRLWGAALTALGFLLPCLEWLWRNFHRP